MDPSLIGIKQVWYNHKF